MKRVRAIIRGHVQGVWFRGWTFDEAGRRGLDGWVRNRHDGTVEAVFAGEEALVDDMIAACWQGPSAAIVRHVEVEPVHEPVAPGFHQASSV
jgi:acylphosphatase